MSNKHNLIGLSEAERLRIILNEIFEDRSHPYNVHGHRNHSIAVEEVRDLFIRLTELEGTPKNMQWKTETIRGLPTTWREG